jgi:quercetin dioxygenase-like cupin family protein
MEIVRFKDARPYVAPKHFDMRSFRLQGEEASGAKTCWVGLSQFLPGGGAESGATPVEKIYIVLSGEITITVDEGEFTLGELDSCMIKANEARAIVNNTNRVATMLVVMQYPKERQ